MRLPPPHNNCWLPSAHTRLHPLLPQQRNNYLQTWARKRVRLLSYRQQGRYSPPFHWGPWGRYKQLLLQHSPKHPAENITGG
jgi:hypothetical protein